MGLPKSPWAIGNRRKVPLRREKTKLFAEKLYRPAKKQ
jgi:hypothetical protein